MNVLYAMLLGLIQGLTEFLPVSSSGHLVLFSTLFGLESAEQSNLLFDVLLHTGTLVAVCIAYWADIVEMIQEVFSWFGGKRSRYAAKRDGFSQGGRMIFLIVVASLPLFLVLPVKDWIEGLRQKPASVGVALIVTGFFLFLSDRIVKGKKTVRSASWKDALFVGLIQALAVTPGISRSGSTITAGLFRGFDRKFAVKFSFLMSLPAVLAATLLSLVDAVQTGIDPGQIPIYLAGMLVAGVSGFYAIKLVRYITKHDHFGIFAYYCWAAGLVTILAVVFGR